MTQFLLLFYKTALSLGDVLETKRLNLCIPKYVVYKLSRITKHQKKKKPHVIKIAYVSTDLILCCYFIHFIFLTKTQSHLPQSPDFRRGKMDGRTKKGEIKSLAIKTTILREQKNTVL